MKRKDTREIHILGKSWEFKIGKNTVAIYNPDNERYFPKFEDIISNSRKPYISPAMIGDYILTKILGHKSQHGRCDYCNVVTSNVSERCDPFNLEIYDDNTQYYICNECFSDREGDI